MKDKEIIELLEKCIFKIDAPDGPIKIFSADKLFKAIKERDKYWLRELDNLYENAQDGMNAAHEAGREER